MLLRLSLIASGAAFAAACSSGSADFANAPYRTAIDTVGDTIVARTSGDVPARFIRRMIIEWKAAGSATDTANMLGDVGGMAIGVDGRVFVWDHVTPSIWLVSADGQSMKRVGRKGSGPGEYEEINGLVVRRDGHFVAWDAGNARLNVYSPDGVAVTSWRVPFANTYMSFGLTADTSNAVWQTGLTLQDGAGGSQSAYLRWSAEGMADTVLAPDMPRGDGIVRARSPDGTRATARNVPFATNASRAVSPYGFVIWGPGRPYTIFARASGRALRIEREFTPVAVADDERAELRAYVEAVMRRVQPAWTWNGPEIPKDKPPYTGLTVGMDGRIWAAINVESIRFEPDPPPATQTNPLPLVHYRAREQRWDVFEPDGRYVGRVAAPDKFTLYVMRADQVWGVLRDENDVPSIVRMRIPGFE